jgi:hypothetical protein
VNRRPLTEHILSLRRYARALTGDAWMADDLVQDTLERACSKYVNQVRRSVRQADAGTSVNADDVAHELLAPESGEAQSIDL